jgi:hypothetical protein
LQAAGHSSMSVGEAGRIGSSFSDAMTQLFSGKVGGTSCVGTPCRMRKSPACVTAPAQQPGTCLSEVNFHDC